MLSPFSQSLYSTVLSEKFNSLLPFFFTCAAVNHYRATITKLEFANFNFVVLSLMYHALTSA